VGLAERNFRGSVFSISVEEKRLAKLVVKA